MLLAAGVDTSTQSCKVVVREVESGRLVREGRASHPDGTEIDPQHWWTAFEQAAGEAGGLDDVAVIGVGGQQHGAVCLDDDGQVVRPALLWNDTRSAAAAVELTRELGGPQAWADAVGLVPVASFTVTKLRWIAEHEPANAARITGVCLPHDWLTWRIAGGTGAPVTDRSDASGTGYWSPTTGAYREDLLELGLGHSARLPEVLAPDAVAGETPWGARLSPGAGDNAAASLGLGARPGDIVVSIGTSGVACAVTDHPVADASGTVAGFADATGRFLPLVASINAARVLSTVGGMLGVDLDHLSALALSAPAGASGVALVPYLDGERTPNRPDSTASLVGLTSTNATPATIARAAVEGLLCGLADAVDAVVAQGVRIERVLLIGGGSRSAAVREIAPAIFGRPVVVPEPGEYVANGAARQAAWVALGGEAAPDWQLGEVRTYEAGATPLVRQRYAEARDLTLPRL